MHKCIDLALLAKARGDSAVGSVLVLDGNIIGSGIEGGKTFGDITYHAEIEAIRDAKRLGTLDLSKSLLYTTHEPCIMCSYVIRHSKISVVVMGMSTGDIGGVNSAYPLLLDKTVTKWSLAPTIISGVLEKECRDLDK